MGTTTTHYEPGVTVLKASGIMTAQDFIDWTINICKEDENNPLLVDITDAQLDLSVEDMYNIALTTIKYRKNRTKTAYLSRPPSSLGTYEYGMTRQYESIARIAGAVNQMEEFTDKEEALEWLRP
jgi:hypothetical protein